MLAVGWSLGLLALLAGCLLWAAPALAWDTELKRAIMRVHLGAATPQDLALVRQSNNVVNNMASTGHMPDRVYQKVQSDFADMNQEVAEQVARKNGLELRRQTSLKTSFAPGTDSDFITSSRSGRTTVEQIRNTVRDYNLEMNRRFGTSNVDYAKKLNTDFMANQQQMSAAEFAEVSKLNNDAYKRQGSAAYEAKVRDPNGRVTVEEAIDYQRDMNDLIAKKSGQIKALKQELGDAYRNDPQGLKAETRNLEAELQVRQQQQAKYIERYNQATTRTAEKYGIDLERPVSSDKIVKGAADRSMAQREGMTQQDVAKQKKMQSATSNALEEHLTQQAKTAGAKVSAEAAGKTGANVAEHDMLMNDAAEKLAELPASRQGEVIEDIRRRLGDDAARELAARTRTANGRIQTLKSREALKQNIKSTAAKVMQISMIATIANDARAWIKGEKSNIEAAESALNLVSQGYYHVGKELGGWKLAYDANYQAYLAGQQARIYGIATDLRKHGVSLEDVRRIMEDMDAGSEASLDRAIGELKAQGIDYRKPPAVERTYFSDRSWREYIADRGSAGLDMLGGILLSPFKLAWDTGKDIGELNLITTDIYKEHARIEDTSLQLIELINGLSQRKLTKRLIELGASPEDAAAAVAAWLTGKPEGLLKLRQLRDRLRTAGLPLGAPPKPASVDPAAVEQRRKHIMDRLAKLNHSKLGQVLDNLGIGATGDLMNCLCRQAGYGSSSTAQFYHPDTIGEYNRTYSCSQPGDPCVVSGFGCTRHPLPSWPEPWEYCMAHHRLNQVKGADGAVDESSGQRLDELIEAKLRERRTEP
jgi:hypothetical protein